MKFKRNLLILLQMCCIQLLSMEIAVKKNHIIKKDCTVKKDSPGEALNFMMVNYLSLFSHTMIRSLAVNKDFETWLLATAKKRKSIFASFIKKHMDEDRLIKHGKWHKYGTSCGFVTSTEKGSGYKVLDLQRFDLMRGLQIKDALYATEKFNGFLEKDDFMKKIEPNYRKSFFDIDDKFCCYGCIRLENGRYGTNKYNVPPCDYILETITKQLDVAHKKGR